MTQQKEGANNPEKTTRELTEQAKVVIVGGNGRMGQLFARLFQKSGYYVDFLEIGNWDHSEAILADASLVIVSVPIDKTLGVIQKLPALPKDCILADLTSVKSDPLEQMLKAHSGPVVGLHPMFGPDVPSLKGQVIIVCDGRRRQAYQWLLELLQVWGSVLNHVSEREHDQAMGLIQALRHFNTFVSGAHLMSEDVNLDQLLEFSSPVYRLELSMIGRLFAQSPDLYAEIIFSAPGNTKLIRRYLDQYQQALLQLEAGDKEGFKETFRSISAWFSPYAEAFYKESSALLAKSSGK